MNPCGEVVIEKNAGILTVNGHSYAGRKTENTNFRTLDPGQSFAACD